MFHECILYFNFKENTWRFYFNNILKAIKSVGKMYDSGQSYISKSLKAIVGFNGLMGR